MAHRVEITFEALGSDLDGTAVVLVQEGPGWSKRSIQLDRAMKGGLRRAARSGNFKGASKANIEILAPRGLSCDRLIAVGIGSTKSLSNDDAIHLGGAIGGILPATTNNRVQIIAEAKSTKIDSGTVADLALGIQLRSYRFDRYKTAASRNDTSDGKSKNPLQVTILCASPTQARKQFNSRQAVGDGVCIARDLVNEPANKLGPIEFADRAEALTKVGVEVKILDVAALEAENMHALLAVGQGSIRPSRVAVMHWYGAANKRTKPIAFIGKGVVFDTGGISLKPAKGMEDMKGDMGGAACVTGLMHTLAARKAKVNAIGIIGLVENMPSAMAIRPGDVIGSKSGQTIEVLNTDAEGRLVLADLLAYAQEHYKPKMMVNLATLTGAVIVALGKEYAGLFSNDDRLAAWLFDAGTKTSEHVWRMPLDERYDKKINSKIADMKNIGGPTAGSITAAQFLQRYVNDTPWAHLDIAGVAMGSNATDINRSWSSGFGVRLLDQLVSDRYERK